MRPRLPGAFAATALSAGLLAAPPAVAEAPEQAGPFNRFDLQVPGKIVYAVDVDVDGDGLTDLLVNHLQGLPPRVKRGVSYFRQRPTGGFGARPDQILSVPERVGITGACPAQGKRGAVLLFMDADGLRRWRFDASSGRFVDRPERFIRTTSFVLWPEEEDLPYWDFCRDFNGDGKLELLVPGPRLTKLYRFSESPELISTIRLKQYSYYESRNSGYYGGPRGPRGYGLRAMNHIPIVYVGEFDGDGRPDLFSIWEYRVHVHTGTEAGGFSERVSYKVFLDPRSKEEKVKRSAWVNGRIGDVNGDGLSDLLMTKVGGGLTNMRTQLFMHVNRRGKGFVPRPDQSLDFEGFSALPSLTRVDSDGRMDLVLPNVSIGLLALGRVLVAGRMDVDFLVYRGQGRSFVREPSVRHELVFPMDYSRGAELQGPYPVYGRDFDGDGRTDLAASVAVDKLGFFPSGEKGLPGDSTIREITLPLSRYLRPFSSRAQPGPTDLLMYWRDDSEREGKILVLLNRGPKAWR